jgi:hypothetical protein
MLLLLMPRLRRPLKKLLPLLNNLVTARAMFHVEQRASLTLQRL